MKKEYNQKERRGVLVPANQSTKFVFGQFIKCVREERPFYFLAELNHAFTLRAVTHNVTMGTSKTFGCLLKGLHFLHLLSIKVLGYLPILNYKPTSFLVVSTLKSRLFVATNWVKKTCQAPFSGLGIGNYINEYQVVREQFSVPIFY